MYQGWLSFAGNEIINAARTEAYATNAALGWFLGCDTCPDLNDGLGDAEYASPLADEAPWFDEDDPDTWQFYGLYPLSITGIEDSSRVAQAVEGLGDGGIVTVPRVATKTIVVAGMLVGGSDAANDAGMNWLRAVLAGSPCNAQMMTGCTGDTLCFLRACPEICGDTDDDLDTCVDDYLMHIHSVTTIEGPKVTAKHPMSDGGSVWEIEFTMVAAKPWICSVGQPVIHGGTIAGDPKLMKPILNVPTISCVVPDMPTFRDPTCEALPKPPTLPDVPLNCFTLPTNWDRYSLPIPAAQVPRWSHAVPDVVIAAPAAAPLRMVRVRFYEDPLNWFDPSALNECDFCSEFLVTYVPPAGIITIDGMMEMITIQQGSTAYQAAQSVTSTDNSGFTWPYLTCGAGFIMTLDIPHGGTPPTTVDVTLYHRSA